ncbi:TPA: 30S ribosomal protein S20 [Patescibacteria group bacterium]|nr:30S ribosomal protein S20 [Patescibacteria group bacterium]
MPITRSAKKKMRGDARKRAINLRQRTVAKKALKSARQNPAVEVNRLAQKALDKAVKAHAIHRNKAARLKSRLMRKRSN